MLTVNDIPDLKDILSINNTHYYGGEVFFVLKTDNLAFSIKYSEHEISKRVTLQNKFSSFVFSKADLSGTIVRFEDLTCVIHCIRRNLYGYSEFYVEIEPI